MSDDGQAAPLFTFALSPKFEIVVVQVELALRQDNILLRTPRSSAFVTIIRARSLITGRNIIVQIDI